MDIKKIITFIFMFSFLFTQEPILLDDIIEECPPCEECQEPCLGTCLSEEETKNLFNNIQECEFNLEKCSKISENLNEQIYMYIQSDSLNQVLLEGYKTQLKLKDEMIKVVKPKWYENKWLWFTIGVISTAGSIKLASELVD